MEEEYGGDSCPWEWAGLRASAAVYLVHVVAFNCGA